MKLYNFAAYRLEGGRFVAVVGLVFVVLDLATDLPGTAGFVSV